MLSASLRARMATAEMGAAAERLLLCCRLSLVSPPPSGTISLTSSLRYSAPSSPVNRSPPLLDKPPLPREIFAALNSVVVGQMEAKKVLSVVVHNHYKRLAVEEQARQRAQQAQSPPAVSVTPPTCQDTRAVASSGNPGQNTLSPPPPSNNNDDDNNPGSNGDNNEPGRVARSAIATMYESSQAPESCSSVTDSPAALSSSIPLDKEYNELQDADMLPYSPPMSSKGEYIQILDDESSFGGSRYFQAIEKSNVLMMGPTGSGKTLLARALAECVNVPFASADATGMTEAGYVGEDVTSVLSSLLVAAGGNATTASMGIVFIDEIDKVAKKNTSRRGGGRDVSGEGVQQGLLKMLEGTVVNVPDKSHRKNARNETVEIDTKNILFICSGAFVGLDQVVRRRLCTKQVGFSESASNPSAVVAASKLKAGVDPSLPSTFLHCVEPEDLKLFGLIPEFIGRLPIVAALSELTEDQLIEVMIRPKNSILKQQARLFELSGVELQVYPEALRAIARQAIKRKSGARGLRSILEGLMMNATYETANATADGLRIECVRLLEEDVTSGCGAKVIYDPTAAEEPTEPEDDQANTGPDDTEEEKIPTQRYSVGVYDRV